MIDLEQLLRRRQDELRGRPLTRWEKFCKRLPYRDEVIDCVGQTCIVIAGLCWTFVIAARTFLQVHH